MLMPAMAMLAVFIYGLFNGILQSFGLLKSAGLNKFTLEYYSETFRNGNLLNSIKVSLIISAVSSVIAVILGVVLSYLFCRTGFVNKRAYNIFKLPIVIPHIVVATLVINLFSQSGLLARLCNLLGIIGSQQEFIPMVFDEKFKGVILGYVWKEVPFIVLVVATIMSNIDGNLGEAAQNLGASPFKAFIYVTLPLCFPSIAMVFIIIFTYSFGAYELPMLLGPTFPKALPVQAYIEYTHPELAHRPYAMVLNTIMIVITIAFAIAYHFLIKKINKKVEVRAYD
ncbi:MAG TPA: ABC transporter permease subunit [Clostridiaceae bacterium]|nr:ABC transporter permease subunit [Clostridiaceae bacterium]